MTSKSLNSILKQTLAPVILVIIFWVIMSAGTTYFIVWVERSNQRIFVENVVSTRAAENMQIIVWQLVATFPDEPEELSNFRSHWNTAKASIESERQILVRSSYMEEESVELSNLNALLSAFFDCFDGLFHTDDDRDLIGSQKLDLAFERSRVLEFADRITASAKSLFELNQAIIDRFHANRKMLNNRVLVARFFTLALGPLIGVYLGWKLGRRLHRSISRIAVTLHDAGSSTQSEIGIVNIDSSRDFTDIEQQAEHVAVRMRKVSRELHAARSEVLQSERLAAVGELAAGVAHEIRNPLTSVKLLLQHAIRQVSGPNLDASKVQLILEEIGRMEKTIQGLLDFSRPPKLNRVHHDFRQTLQRALNLVDARSRQQQIEIVTHICDSPLMVDGDTEKLHQLLVNLLINAIEAMPDGGHLSIDVTKQAKQKPIASHHSLDESDDEKDEHVAEIIIRDTGEGIAGDLLPRLFEPFATTKERGTGLGLAVSLRIAEEHFGTIRATNDPRGGARFTLTIPIADESRNAH